MFDNHLLVKVGSVARFPPESTKPPDGETRGGGDIRSRRVRSLGNDHSYGCVKIGSCRARSAVSASSRGPGCGLVRGYPLRAAEDSVLCLEGVSRRSLSAEEDGVSRVEVGVNSEVDSGGSRRGSVIGFHLGGKAARCSTARDDVVAVCSLHKEVSFVGDYDEFVADEELVAEDQVVGDVSHVCPGRVGVGLAREGVVLANFHDKGHFGDMGAAIEVLAVCRDESFRSVGYSSWSVAGHSSTNDVGVGTGVDKGVEPDRFSVAKVTVDSDEHLRPDVVLFGVRFAGDVR